MINSSKIYKMTKAKLILIITVHLFILVGCVKDYKSSTQTKLINTTNHTIKITPYLNGVIDIGMQQELMPNETKIVYEANPWGKTIEPCWGVFLRPDDSVIVIYDNTYKMKHNRFNDTTTCDNCYIESNNRNLTNPNNYTPTIIKEEKEYLDGYYTYTFTEQDYLDAKK